MLANQSQPSQGQPFYLVNYKMSNVPVLYFCGLIWFSNLLVEKMCDFPMITMINRLGDTF